MKFKIPCMDCSTEVTVETPNFITSPPQMVVCQDCLQRRKNNKNEKQKISVIEEVSEI